MDNEKNGNEALALPIDNLDNLKEKVKMSGFGDHFDQQIEQNVLAGKDSFTLSKPSDIDGDQIEYSLDIRIDKEARKGYVNDLHATLTEADGTQRNQTFPRYLRITAKEAYNLLKWGTDTAVEKHLFNKKGEPYTSYVALNIKGEKDQYGNYPLTQYSENYYRSPFTVESALDKITTPVKELQQDPERIISSVKRGNMTSVTLFHDGQEQKGFLSLNAKAGVVDVRDSKFMIIHGEKKDMSQEKKADMTPKLTQNTEPVKKNPSLETTKKSKGITR